MLPRKWSVPCGVGEMRYKFRIKLREGFQLIDLSDFGLSLQVITIMVKKVSNDNLELQSQKKYFHSK
jgi:hypothetical protein